MKWKRGGPSCRKKKTTEKYLAASILTKVLPLSEMIVQCSLHPSTFFLSLHTPAVGEIETSVILTPSKDYKTTQC
jgi:hypothetical protein